MDNLRGHLELVLLAVISGRPAHGWAIIDEARRRSHGVIDLGEGGIYLILHKLQREGFLQSSWTQGGGRSRRVYRLTRKGRAELAKRRDEWRRVAFGMNALLQDT